LSDEDCVLGSCGCGARFWEEQGNSTVLGVCERCEIKEKFTYGKKSYKENCSSVVYMYAPFYCMLVVVMTFLYGYPSWVDTCQNSTVSCNLLLNIACATVSMMPC
jgi:hypothetical protein